MSMMINPYVFAAVGGGTLWTPINMTAVPQIYLDAQDSVVTDVSGFASAISNLGAMGANGDFSQGTSGNRPAILDAELNGKRVLSFDGSNDVLTGGSTAQKNLFRFVSAAWVFTVYKKRSTDGAPAFRYLFYASTTVAAERFLALAGATGANMPALYGRRLDAESSANISASSAVSGYYSMTLHGINYATREGKILVDGSVAVSNPTMTTTAGSTSNTASVNPLSIGATVTGAVAADIDLAAIISSNTQPSTDDVDRLFGWAAHKYGLTANLPAEHPYKTVAPTV